MLVTALLGAHSTTARAADYRRLPVREYVDKMKAGWIGQMAGVGQGGPTEFRWKGAIIPEDKMPRWKPEMINQFNQDDIYVEMTFLRTLELHGMEVSLRQAGIDFANSGYPLWHANRNGRDNLRNGIAPPDSGHPQFNQHADDIDYQIEADYSGLIAPGLPNVGIRLGEIFGRLMNYGDGMYGGQFVAGMYAAAFFEKDPVKIVEAGLRCIPAQSQYAECIRDVLRWHQAEPRDWATTWRKIGAKYHDNPAYRRFSCNKGAFDIDAKINGAYIVMGLLYGQGDPNETITIATRCGQDSDCNPSNAGGVLFTTIGYAKLPAYYKSALNPNGKFSHTPYTFPKLIQVCEQLVRDSVRRAGGRIEKDAAGEEVFVIPVQAPKPSAFVQCWEPGPIAHSRFTEAELDQITALSGRRKVRQFMAQHLAGWTLHQCGADMAAPAVLDQWHGRANVLMVHPLNRKTPCALKKTVTVPRGKQTTLQLQVSHHPDGDWDLILKADGQTLNRQTVSQATAKGGWLEVRQDLSRFAGRTVQLEILNQPTGWSFEAGYFGAIEIVSQ